MVERNLHQLFHIVLKLTLIHIKLFAPLGGGAQVIDECLSFHSVYSRSELSNTFSMSKSMKLMHLGSVPFMQLFNYDAKGDLKNEQLLKDPRTLGFHQDL